jgi:hypothetical protein
VLPLLLIFELPPPLLLVLLLPLLVLFPNLCS